METTLFRDPPTVHPSHVVEARGYAKINLVLHVGPVREDGYHDLTSVFHTVNLYNRVLVASYAPKRFPDHQGDSRVVGLNATGLHARRVPCDESNLAWIAADKVVSAYVARGVQLADMPLLKIAIVKGIPTAGGMAGGSADGAAAVAATHRLLSARFGDLDEDTIFTILAELGSDVPFSYVGKTQLGQGRGEILTPMLCRGTYHWVIAVQRDGLSTPAVFQRLDEMRAEEGNDAPASATADTTAMSQALLSGDPQRLADCIHNDLQSAALSLMPSLHSVLGVGREAGALAGFVSGSGPTVVFLCRDEQHAHDVAEELIDSGRAMTALATASPAPGVTITSG